MSLPEHYTAVRGQTEALCQPLETEDYVVSSMVDVSPTKWHLAHTSWFFETFVLREHWPAYTPRDDRYAYLFNSYYVQAGEHPCRAQRGLVTRPTVAEVYAYRAHVDEAMAALLGGASPVHLGLPGMPLLPRRRRLIAAADAIAREHPRLHFLQAFLGSLWRPECGVADLVELPAMRGHRRSPNAGELMPT